MVVTRLILVLICVDFNFLILSNAIECETGDITCIRKRSCEYNKDRFICDDHSKCLSHTSRCNNIIECIDGSDELGCNQCLGFLCKNKVCLPKQKQCDGYNDCSDGSDEENCDLDRSCLSQSDRFKCFNGKCISKKLVCNGKNDCETGEDEDDCVIPGCELIKCKHGCFKGNAGPQCSCPLHFTLAQDSLTCIDIDECKQTNTNICSHNCKNLEGDYSCSCQDGFKLVNKNKCVARTSEAMLIYADYRSIKVMWIKKKKEFLIAKAKYSSIAVSMNHQSKVIYYADVGKDKSLIYSVDFNKNNVKPVVTSGLISPKDIAVDYLTRNFYIADNGIKQIVVCRYDGLFCSSIIINLNNVSSIALNLENGTIYWSDCSAKTPGIYIARMDGKNKIRLVSSYISEPNGVTYDRFKTRLYWADSKLQHIEYYDFNINKRVTVVELFLNHPFSLSMFEDKLYWSNLGSNFVFECDKFKGIEQSITVNGTNDISSIHVYHPSNFVFFPSPCWSAPCSHLCIIISKVRYKCACPNNMYLKDEVRCVLKNTNSYLLINLERNIKNLYPENIGYDISDDFVYNISKKISIISDFAYSFNRNLIFIFDGQTKIISSFNPKTQELSQILKSDLESLHSLIYDDFSNNLYWLNIGKGYLEVASSDGKKRQVLINNLKTPSSIALYQEKNEMFISQLKGQPSISVCDLDGRNCKVVINDVKAPSSLAISKSENILYWSDSKRKTIEMVFLDSYSSKSVLINRVEDVASIAVNKGIIYWTNLQTDLMYIFKKNDTRLSTVKLFDVRPKKFKKIIFSYKENTINRCTKQVNTCDHICIFGGLSYDTNVNSYLPKSNCICPVDQILSENGKECLDKKYCSTGFFVCKSTKQCIKQSEVCDGHKNCENNEDEIGCPEVKPCSMYESRCDDKNITSPCISNSWFCDGERDCENGFDELNCHNFKQKSIFSDVPFKSIEKNACDPGYFKCDETKCLPWHFVCNGEINCRDKTDEGKDCLLKCSCKNNGKCLMVEGIWTCVCPVNYEGRECEFEKKVLNTNEHKLVMQKNFDFGETFSSEKFLENSSDNSSGFFTIFILMLTIVAIVAIICVIYIYENEPDISLLKRRLTRNINYEFRKTMDGKDFDINNHTVDLLGHMECQPEKYGA